MTTGTSETEAYRVWLTNENKLKISRDIIILDVDVDNNNIKIINEEHLLSENEFINNEDNEHEENMIQNYDNNTSINDSFKGFSPASISKSNQNNFSTLRLNKYGVRLLYLSTPRDFDLRSDTPIHGSRLRYLPTPPIYGVRPLPFHTPD
ncbi:hypothetical protein HCN44_004818 [Aphidius gifuensis]|uniref:Uncharacterized protein n=1 Tax=Aphidius gifuensis TaxID=684658 RepID=A0A835CQ31_APHGI|nr:hypothetical protein HCN44_004818 [Aphidius gifuensis]